MTSFEQIIGAPQLQSSIIHRRCKTWITDIRNILLPGSYILEDKSFQSHIELKPYRGFIYNTHEIGLQECVL